MREWVGLLPLLFPLAAIAAPVPTHLMANPEIQLRHHPLGNHFELTIRNVGGAELPIWTNQPSGIYSFIDAEVYNEKGERVSRYYRWQAPAKADAASKLVETIPMGKSWVATIPAFDAVDEGKFVPGKYKIRVRFKYKGHDAVSNWLEVEVSELQIRLKALELGR